VMGVFYECARCGCDFHDDGDGICDAKADRYIEPAATDVAHRFVMSMATKIGLSAVLWSYSLWIGYWMH
jgi:hypothetical protein